MLLIGVSLVLLPSMARAEPWWEEGKTRWFWAQWDRFIPTMSWEEIMLDLSVVGATGCVDHGAVPFEGQIYLANAGGTNPVNISSNRSCDTGPEWSPNGHTIAFSSDRDGDWNLYVMNADGTGQRKLTAVPGTEQHPACSPNGNQIAAAFEDSKHRRREKSGILVVTLEPLGVQEVLAVDPLMPKPGGSIEEEKPRYKLIGGWYFEGNAARRWLPKRFASIQSSSDGSRIAFLSDLDPSGYDFLFSMADDSSDMTRIDGSMNPAGPHNQLPVATQPDKKERNKERDKE